MLFNNITDGRKVRSFSLSQSFLDQYRARRPNWGFNGLGEFVFRRTYSRPLDSSDPEGPSEDWWQTCKRVVEGVYNIQKIHCRQYGLPWNEQKAQRSSQEMYDKMWSFKWLPPGRGLWAMGTDALFQKGAAILLNCGFVSTEHIDIDFAAPFTFLMDMSMLGVGVGSDTRGAGKIKLVRPTVTETPFIVEDSREGWVALLRVILSSFVGKNAYPTSVDYSQVRPRGTPLKGFGGIASGPEPLMEMVDSITRLLMPPAEGQKITSTQIVDCFNFIGRCVVAGGIRRSSEIMLGFPEDEEFMSLKQDESKLKSHRWSSNNSVFANIGTDYSNLATLIAKNGEPGVVWLHNMRQFYRMDGNACNADRLVAGTNPCGEIALESGECCNLVETFPAHHASFEDYKRTLKYAYLYAKTVTLIPTHDENTNRVMMKNRRIGCSQSGIMQAIHALGRREFLSWCDNGYSYLKELDEIYSDWLGIPKSKKISTTKPSGSVSILAGATPGIHYPHAEYYIRNVRVANTSHLVDACRNAGYTVESDTYAPDTSVISFPAKTDNFSKGKIDATIWEQFMNAIDLQRYWADNQVSVTVSFKPEEAKDIKTCLEVAETRLKSVSLMPLQDHGYEQAPYITISKEEYESLINRIRPISFTKARHEVTEVFCDGENCSLI